jgi:hypothetical protein
MENLILRIERTLDVVVPFLLTVFSALQIAKVITVVDIALPIIYGLLTTVELVFKIWGITLRGRQKAKA